MNYKNNFHVLYLQVVQKCTRRVFLLLFLLTLMNYTIFAQTNSSSIAWNTNFASAQMIAQSVNRPLFLFFEGVPTNAITLSLLQNTFTDSKIIEAINTHFVPLRIKNDAQLVSTFNVIRYPTIMITDSTGEKIINSISGIMSTQNIIDLLNTNTNAYNDNVNTNTNAYNDNTAITSAETAIESFSPPQSQTESLIPEENTSTQSGKSVSEYRYSGGSFIQTDDVQWVHKTPFYTVNYKVFSDSKFFYYLESENKKTFIAVPKSQNNSLWIWKSNVWHRISREEE